MVARGGSESEIETLRRQVAELERALRRRSRQLVLLLDRMPPELYPIARQILGERPLAPRFAVQPGTWVETTDLVSADVEEVLADLWSATGPPERTPLL